MKRIATYLFVTVISGAYAPVSAQETDTTSAWRYLPLEVGNVWEYDYNYYGCDYDYCERPDELLGFWRRTVTQDSLVEGTQYKVIREERFTPEGLPEDRGAYDVLVRFDTLEARAVRYSQARGEEPWLTFDPCRLDTGFEGKAECGEYASETYMYGGYDTAVTIGSDVVVTAMKGFQTAYSGTEFAADIGHTSSIAGKFDEYNVDRLLYARVGSVEYGERFTVGSEDVAPDASSVTLAVYPNPVRDVAVLRFTLDRPQTATLAVYDVLGRRVLRDNLGVLPTGERTHRLDLASLPPGIYLIQFTGEAGARMTSRLTLQ